MEIKKRKSEMPKVKIKGVDFFYFLSWEIKKKYRKGKNKILKELLIFFLDSAIVRKKKDNVKCRR